MHVPHDPQIAYPGVRNLSLEKRTRHDSCDLAAGGQNCVGKAPMSPTLPPP
jgi:hypothetical protein